MIKNKKIIVLTFVGLSVISMVYLYYRSSPRQELNTTTVIPTIKTPNLMQGAVTFNFPDNLQPDFPKELLIYSVEKSILDISTADKIAQHLKFSTKSQVINDPVYGISYAWRQDNRFLLIKFKDRIINYYGSILHEDLDTGFNIPEEQIIQTAQNFVEPINSDFSLKLQPDKLIFYEFSGEEVKTPTSPVNAQTVNIEYVTYLENLPIIGSADLLSPPSNISLDNNLNIISASLTLAPLKLTPSEIHPLLSYQEIVEKASEARAINISNPETLDPTSDLFSGPISVTDVYLAYYQYSGQQIMQPVYVIEGQGKTKSGSMAEGTFILPAVKN
jgi:hypothetical protein